MKKLCLYSGFRCHNNNLSANLSPSLGCFLLLHSPHPLSCEVVFVLRAVADAAVPMKRHKSHWSELLNSCCFLFCFLTISVFQACRWHFWKHRCPPLPLLLLNSYSFFFDIKQNVLFFFMSVENQKSKLTLLVHGAAVWKTLRRLPWHWTQPIVLKRSFFITLLYAHRFGLCWITVVIILFKTFFQLFCF